MSDLDEHGRYEPDADERREAWEQRRARHRRGCACGYPDWPGQCPGTANCPVANYGRDEQESDDGED